MNSIITIAIAVVNMLMFIIGTFLWGTVTKTQEEMQKLNTSMASAIANQVNLQRTMEQIVPKGELDLRFKAIEIETLSLKTAIQENAVRIQRTEASLLKLQAQVDGRK